MRAIAKRRTPKLLDAARRGELEREFEARRTQFLATHPHADPWAYLQGMRQIAREVV